MDLKNLFQEIATQTEAIEEALKLMIKILGKEGIKIDVLPVLNQLSVVLLPLEYLKLKFDTKNTIFIEDGLELVVSIDANDFVTYFFNNNNRVFTNYTNGFSIPDTYQHLFRIAVTELKSKAINIHFDLDNDKKINPGYVTQEVVKPVNAYLEPTKPLTDWDSPATIKTELEELNRLRSNTSTANPDTPSYKDYTN